MTHRLRMLVAGSTVLLLSTLPWARARAELVQCTLDSEAAATSEYQRAIDLALREYHAQHFSAAASWFERAHASCPSARTLRGLGLTAFELGRYEESADFLRRALADPTRPLAGVLRVETADLLARSERLLSLARRLQTEAHGSEPMTLRLALERLPEPCAWRGPRLPLPARSVLSPTPSSREPNTVNIPRWLWTSVGVISLAAALGLGFGLRTRPTQTEAAIADQPVATRGGP